MIRSNCGAWKLALVFLCLLVTPLDAAVSQAQIDDVGGELACLCGGCPRRPLDECTCGYAKQQRDRIKSMLSSGQSKQTIVDAFVAEFGKRVRSAPLAEGFDLTAWAMPPLALLLGIFVVRAVLRGWSQSQPKTPEPAPKPGVKDPYLSRLEQELRERD